MKSKIMSLVLLFALGACVKKVPGTLEVTETVSLRGKDGLVNLQPGTYFSTLKLKKSKKVTLELQNGKKQKVIFTVPKGTTIPRSYGEMRLTSAEVGQPYDVTAKVQTLSSSSEIRHTTETCSRSVVRDVCTFRPGPIRTQCHVDRYGRRICREVRAPSVRVCNPVSRIVYGTRNVAYRITGRTTEFTFTLFDEASQAPLANFKGTEFNSNRDIVSYGVCRVGPSVIFP